MLKRPRSADNGGEEGGSSAQQSKQQRPIWNALRDAMRLPSMETLPFVLEPFLRKVVRDEVEKTIVCYMNPSSRASFSQISRSTARRWRLEFVNKLPHTLFAGSRILADDKSPVEIAMMDLDSNTIVRSGPLASVKTKLLVLDGEFGADEQATWTEEEFNDRLVRERDGKRPLLAGDLSITLKEGVGFLGEVTFTDNSSWIRSRRFRLSVKAQSSPVGGGIQEGVSGAFLVKDHRGELYKKHYPPSLDDEVWRLKKIGKDGAFQKRLMENNINTVQDFLRLLVVNQDMLRDILGCGMTNKMWNTIVEHALQCRLGDKLYSCTLIEQHHTIYVNSIFDVIGVNFEGSCYQQFSELTVQQKAFVINLREFAYANRNNKDKIEITEIPVDHITPPLLMDAGCSSASTLEDIPVPCGPFEHQDELAAQIPFKHPITINEQHEDQCLLKQFSNVQMPSPVKQLFPSTGSFTQNDLLGQNYQPHLSPSEWAGLTTDALMSHNPDICCLQLPRECDSENALFQCCGNYVDQSPSIYCRDAPISPRKWFKLIAALKFGMWTRKRLAAMRMARISNVDHQTYSGFHGNYQSYADFPGPF